MALVSSVCSVVDLLSDYQQKVISAINGKFASLRRLSELLQQLADLTPFIPDISKLIPVMSIDLSLYENLRTSCKFLNLPPSQGSPEEVLGSIRAQVDAAYGRLLKQIDLHPLSRLDKLQAKLDGYQQQFNIGVLNGVDFMSCLQASCQTVVAASDSISSLSKLKTSDVTKAATTYLTNMVEGQGKVLGAATQAKVDNWKSVRTSVVKLTTTVPELGLGA